MLFWACVFYFLGAADFIYTARCFSLRLLSFNVMRRAFLWPLYTCKLWLDEAIEAYEHFNAR